MAKRQHLGPENQNVARPGPRRLRKAQKPAAANLAEDLQHTYGNRYMQRLLESKAVQAKLTVSGPSDASEVEADRVAKMVTDPSSSLQREAKSEEEEEPVQARISRLQRQASPEEDEDVQTKSNNLQREAESEEEEDIQAKSSLLQRQAESEEEDEEVQAKASGVQRSESDEDELQTKGQGVDLQVDDELEDSINASRGQGAPLAGSARDSLEPRFGADFSGVKVHTGAEADSLSRQLKAEAFTTGKDIYFKEGRYQPDTSDGKKLIAHELTHVIQQGAAGTVTNRKANEDGMVRNEKPGLRISHVPANSNAKISRWGGSAHKELTVNAANSIMPHKPVLINELKDASVKMDWRVRRILGAIIPFIKHLFGAPIAGEGPEHGEDGNYKNPDINACSSANIAVQNERLNQAISAKKAFYATTDKSSRKKSFDRVVEYLGDALHIAQDRGSHWEGAKGQGHDDIREKNGKYDTDDPADNKAGYDKAKKNTEDVLKRYEGAK